MKTKMLLCSVLAVASSAHAAGYASFSAGSGKAPVGPFGAAVEASEFAQYGFTPVGVTSRKLSAHPYGFEAGFGVELTPNTAVELRYHYFDTTEVRTAGSMRLPDGREVPYTHTTDVDSGGFSLALLGRWPVSPHWALYGRAGALRAHIKAGAALCGGTCTDPGRNPTPLFAGPRATAAPADDFPFSINTGVDYRRDVIAPFASLGVLFTLGEDWTVRLDYSAYRIRPPRNALPKNAPYGDPFPSVPLEVSTGTSRFLMLGFTANLHGSAQH